LQEAQKPAERRALVDAQGRAMDETHLSSRVLVMAMLFVACADNQGAASVSNMATAGPAGTNAGSTAGAESGAGGTGATLGSAGTQGAAAAGVAGPGGRGASTSAGLGGALGAGAGGVGGPSMAGMSAAGVPAAGAAAGTPAANADDCDRACLLAIMKDYTDALLAKDASKLKVSTDLKYTENGVAAKLGETVWKTVMSLVPDTSLSFADPVAGQVASQFVFAESGSVQKISQVRLKVVRHEITEIESMVVKSGDQFFNPAGMKPEPVFLQMVDPAKRTKREQLKAITELYLGYLEGKTQASEVGFDMNCKRSENGTVTANGLASFNSQRWSFQVTHRILVIDEEAGITWGMFPFQQTATALVVGEAFKIIDGKIMMIQAVMTNMPAKTWD
jgi:hypothetical protein